MRARSATTRIGGFSTRIGRLAIRIGGLAMRISKLAMRVARFCARLGFVHGSDLFLTGLLQVIAFARPTASRGFGSVKNHLSHLITLPAVVIVNAVKQSRLFSATAYASAERQRGLEYSIEQLFFNYIINLNSNQNENEFYENVFDAGRRALHGNSVCANSYVGGE
jgi:hypothetical protein